MRLLHAPTPVDTATIALWLGHETLDSTNKYIHADMELKRRALDRTTPTERQTRPLPAARPATRVPREPLTNRNMSTPRRPATTNTRGASADRNIGRSATWFGICRIRHMPNLRVTDRTPGAVIDVARD